VSAKTGDGVDAAFACLATHVMAARERWGGDAGADGKSAVETLLLDHCACG